MLLSRLDDMTAADPAPPMVVRLPARPLTLDDVAALAAGDSSGAGRFELDEGTLVVMAPPDTEHIAIVSRMLMWLVNHGFAVDEVLANPGVKIREQTSGRCPDLMVLSGRVPGDTVWIDPAAVLLVVEVVSRGSAKLDRVIKPIEYANAGIPRYWRVERGDNRATVHMYRLGPDERGEAAYVDHEAVLLDKLLAGAPPELS
jgi:Uma2 family endonuclease